MLERKIVQYDIVSSNNYTDLVRRVNDAICRGWVPFGGVSYNSNYNNYCQAIVKYESGFGE